MLLNPRVLVAFPACWLVAAHFLRFGLLPLAALYLLAPWLLVSGRLWALQLNRGLLWLGVAVWVYATAGFIDERFERRKAFVRLSLIMAAVTAGTAAAAKTLGSPVVREGFR
ncbi:MAG: hypothetical protein HY553_08835 [Elusimicrobia bacterium]|nr:hypothetical protein [Elusimicrobiota bacterium]